MVEVNLKDMAIDVPEDLYPWAKYLAIDPPGRGWRCSIFIFSTRPEYDREDGWLPELGTDGFFEKVGEISADMAPDWLSEHYWQLY